MELNNEFEVTAPLDEAWRILTDIELIAPCMPGARLTEVEGETFRGTVKVKVGPISAQFKGAASFVEKDDDAHRAVLKAQGRDTGGKGSANATITAHLVPAGEGTRVTITTDLSISGRVAQFGRGALADISTKLIGQFTDCLEHRVLADGQGAPAEPSAEHAPAQDRAVPEDPPEGRHPADFEPADGDASSHLAAVPSPEPPATPSGTAASVGAGSGATGAPLGARQIDAPEAEPIDLLETARGTVVQRLVPIVGGLLVVLWMLRRRRRR